MDFSREVDMWCISKNIQLSYNRVQFQDAVIESLLAWISWYLMNVTTQVGPNHSSKDNCNVQKWVLQQKL